MINKGLVIAFGTLFQMNLYLLTPYARQQHSVIQYHQVAVTYGGVWGSSVRNFTLVRDKNNIDVVSD